MSSELMIRVSHDSQLAHVRSFLEKYGLFDGTTYRYSFYILNLQKYLPENFEIKVNRERIVRIYLPKEEILNNELLAHACDDILDVIQPNHQRADYYSVIFNSLIVPQLRLYKFSKFVNAIASTLIIQGKLYIDIDISHHITTRISKPTHFYKLIRLIDAFNEAARDPELLAKLLVTRCLKLAEIIERKYPKLWDKIFTEYPDPHDVVEMYRRHASAYSNLRNAGWAGIIVVHNNVMLRHVPVLHRLRSIVAAYHIWSQYLDQYILRRI